MDMGKDLWTISDEREEVVAKGETVTGNGRRNPKYTKQTKLDKRYKEKLEVKLPFCQWRKNVRQMVVEEKVPHNKKKNNNKNNNSMLL